MAIVTVSKDYRITIPREVREALDIRPGDRLRCIVEGHTVTLVPIREAEEPRHADTA